MKYIKRLGISIVWLLLWQAVSFVVDNHIILAGPVEVAVTLFNDIFTVGFWLRIAFSLVRITLGFLAAFTFGVLLGVLAGHAKAVMEFLEPAVQFMKSVPVVCFIVILLIWFGSSFVSTIAVFFVAFPALYTAVLQAHHVRDTKTLHMLRLFKVSAWRRALAFSWPSYQPFLLSASRVAVGMSWKAGVAAELIGLPLGSIGESIYHAKLTFSSADLFSWTIVVVIISLICEWLFLILLKESEQWAWRAALPRYDRGGKSASPETPSDNGAAPSGSGLSSVNEHTFSDDGSTSGTTPRPPSSDPVTVECPSDLPEGCKVRSPHASIRLEDVTVSYEDEVILCKLSLELAPGGSYALRGVSGSGKTTVLSVIEGFIVPTSGVVEVNGTVSAVFQDDRLFEGHDAIENVQLFAGQCVSRAKIRAVLEELLPADSLNKPVSELSGGMRRRVELVRALLTPGEILLLDEPFSGLDDESRTRAQELIKRERRGRTLIVATHGLQDEKALALEALHLNRLGEQVGLAKVGDTP